MTDVAEAVRSTVLAKAAALVERAPDRLAALLDPAFVYLNVRGERFDRAGYVERFCTSGRIRFTSQQFEALEVTDLGTFAVATMIVHDRFDHPEGRFAGSFRSLCVFRPSSTTWLWCAGQTAILPAHSE